MSRDPKHTIYDYTSPEFLANETNDGDSCGGITMGLVSTNKTYTYDAANRLTSVTDGDGAITTHDDPHGRAIDPAAPPLPPPAEPLPPMEPMQRLLGHTFELRLSGSEEQRQAIYLPPVPPGDRIVVTTVQVRSLVTRGADAAMAGTVIGTIEVRTERRPMTDKHPERLVCIAQASDFGPNDLVVVHAEVTVFWVLCGQEST